jgi:hypothetical protein
MTPNQPIQRTVQQRRIGDHAQVDGEVQDMHGVKGLNSPLFLLEAKKVWV